MIRQFALVLLVLVFPSIAHAQQSIIIVRHAERQSGEGDDSLSDAGRQRAERLAAILKDAGVTHVFVSDRRRTAETAEPIARTRKLTPTRMTIPAAASGKVSPAERQVRDTLRAIAKLPRTAVALVVGHSDTVPMFLRRLGHPVAITIPDTEFDNLFIVTPRPTRPPSVVRLRF